MRTWMMTLILFVSLGLFGQADDAYFEAARAGDLAKVRSVIEAGAPVNARNRYGLTALALASQNNHLQVAEFLLEKGADPNIPDSFYNVKPLTNVLFTEYVGMVVLLLKYGAEPRETALEVALNTGLPEHVAAVLTSGPVNESALKEAKVRAASMDPAIGQLLANAQFRPDPEIPSFSKQELARFVGSFEGFVSDNTGVVTLSDKNLRVSVNGAGPVVLTPTGGRDFDLKDGSARLTFVGRAGTIEGFVLFREGEQPDLLRHSVAEPNAKAMPPMDIIKRDVNASPVVNWPGFRGRNATGVGDGKAIPDWDLPSGKGILWQKDLDGLGNSSPVVWQDKIFITSAVAEGFEQKLRVGNTGDGSSVEGEAEVMHHWRVYAYDKATGKELWETEIGKGKPLTKRHFKATQANSTPATDGKHLVVVFPTAGLACLDMNGKVLWHHDLGGLNASAFFDPNTEWGFAASPIIYKNMAILQVDIYGEPYIAAWDLATGKEVWKSKREVATSWSTPAIFKTDQGDELIVNGSTIYGYDPNTGKELWRLGPNSELVIAAPVVGDDVVYVSAGYPPVKPVYAVKAGIRGAHEVTPGEKHDHLLWSHRRGGAYMPTPLLYRGLLYIVHHNGRMVIYNPENGEAIHKTRFSNGGTFTGSPVAVNGKLYIPTEEGTLYVLAAEPGFKELGAHDFGEPLMATPAVSDGKMFVRTPSRLLAIGGQ